MFPIDIPAIERQARELRAAEIQRMNGLFAERTRLLTRLAATTAAAGAHAISEMLRPLFSCCRLASRQLSAVSMTLRGLSFPGTRRIVASERRAANNAGGLTRIFDG